jgi:hypothetical protein
MLEQKVRNRTVEHEKIMADAARLQQQAKAKELETAQLKKELAEVKSKINKANKPNI